MTTPPRLARPRVTRGHDRGDAEHRRGLAHRPAAARTTPPAPSALNPRPLDTRKESPDARLRRDRRARMSYQTGDRVALVQTSDPYTRLTPGTAGTVTGYDGRLGQLAVTWDDGSTLSMLLRDGDHVRLIAPARPPAAGSLPGSRAGSGNQDITDPATGGSRLLSRQCPTCILRHGDPMHLGPERLREIIGQALASGQLRGLPRHLDLWRLPGLRSRDLPGILRRLPQPVTRADPAAGLPAPHRGAPAGSCLPGQLTWPAAADRPRTGADRGRPRSPGARPLPP